MADWYDACKGCIYLGTTGPYLTCDYMLIAGPRRPCPRGPGCTVKEVSETKKWDKAKAFELYQAGLSDSQIAQEVGVSQRTIFVWRKEEMLPPNKRVSPAAPKEAEPRSVPPGPPEPEPPPKPKAVEAQPEGEPEGPGRDGSGHKRTDPDGSGHNGTDSDGSGPVELHLELCGGWARIRAHGWAQAAKLWRMMDVCIAALRTEGGDE